VAGIAGVIVLFAAGYVVPSALHAVRVPASPDLAAEPQPADVARGVVDDAAQSAAVAEASGPLYGTASGQAAARPGTYLLFAACASTAAARLLITVTRPAAEHQLSAASVPCDASPQVSRTKFRMPELGPLEISVTGLAAGGDQVRYAYKLVPYALDAAPPASDTATANAATAQGRVEGVAGVVKATAVTTEAAQSAWLGRFSAEQLFVELSCVGPGTVAVTVRSGTADAGSLEQLAGPVLATGTLSCSVGGDPVRLPVTVAAAGDLAVETRPDKAALNRAGVAFAAAFT
jgi:hypothetical protein